MYSIYVDIYAESVYTQICPVCTVSWNTLYMFIARYEYKLNVKVATVWLIDLIWAALISNYFGNLLTVLRHFSASF